MDLHSEPRGKDAMSFGPFRLFPSERLLERGDEPVQLGSRALDILIALVERAGEVVANKELVAKVWPGVTIDDGGLRVHIAGLRKALGDGRDGARYVTNIPSRGYCFVAPVSHGNEQEASAGSTYTRLPASLKRMIGRDEAVQAITAQLMADRFVTIVGAGGMGKTTVAIATAHALLADFDQAVAFIDLGALTDPRLVAGTIASTLGLIVQASDPVPSLVAALSEERLLLVLDNCEHVVDTVAPLAEMIFDAATQVHILATSREALRVEGEHVHRLAPLESPAFNAGLSAAEAMTFPAVQLFVERTAANGTTLDLSDADAPVVGDICRSLDGLALAIELAASRVNAHGFRGTAELLENRFGLHWQGRRTALPRHQTLNAMLDWSYTLLPEAERLILRRLSVFVGMFSLAAAQDVASGAEDDAIDVADALASLVEKSLVSTAATNRGTSYRLLEMTRVYALEKLVETGEAEQIALHHAVHFSRLLEQMAGSTSATAEPLGNVRAALAWCFSSHGQTGIGTGLAALAAPMFLELSLLGECLEWSERALQALTEAERGTPIEMDLQETLAISSMFTRGNGDDVYAAILRGLALAEMLGDSQHRLRMLAGLNIFLTRIGDFRGALDVAEQSQTTARSLGDPAGLIMADWMLGVAHHLVGDQAAAQRHCEAGFARASASPQANTGFFGYDHRIRALVALTRALWLGGFPDQALVVAHQAIDEAAARDQPVNTCIALIYTAPVFIWCGDWAKAREIIERLIAHSSRHSLTPYHAVGLGLKGELLIRTGDAQAGLDLLHGALDSLGEEHHYVQATSFMTAAAEGLAALERYEAALDTIDGAIARAVRNADSFDTPEMLRVKGNILSSPPQSDFAGAEACLRHSIERARASAALSLELRSAMSFARLMAGQDRFEEAQGLLGDVVARFGEGFSTRDLGDARQLLERMSHASA
jgi:predicted ATPase/DNA-binding winged helix-turn-helix (wHTH) protein